MEAIFYIPEIDLSQNMCLLPQEEAKHIIRVLRMHQGDTLLLTDGKGHFVQSHIDSIEGKKCFVAFDEIQKQEKLPYELHLAVAPTKNISRYEWLLEKATEIGVHKVTPLLTFHSERRSVNNNRLEKIMIAAMKQSQKAYLPKLSEPIQFSDFLQMHKRGVGYIAHCNEAFARKSINEIYQRESKVTLMIGPEGDFSQEEIQKAIDTGFQSVHLGKSRLRTETAGVVACSTIYQLNY